MAIALGQPDAQPQWIDALWDDPRGGANGDGEIFSIPVTGGTPTILLSFNGTDGANPAASLTLSAIERFME